MRRVLFLAMFVLGCFSAWGQEVADSVGLPVTVSERPVKVKTAGVTYSYVDVHVVPVPGYFVTPETIRRYEPYTAILRDSLLFGKNRREAQRDMMEELRKLSAGPDPEVREFDVTKVRWREKLMAVDVYGGVSAAMPMGFLMGYTGPAAGLTADLGVYVQRAFARLAIGGGLAPAARDKHMAGAKADGRAVPDFNLSVNFGYMIGCGGRFGAASSASTGSGSRGPRFAISPFVGFGYDGWSYSVDGYGYKVGGLAINEGLEMTLFLHRTVRLSVNEPHYTNSALRLRLYSGQIVSSAANGVVPTVNASLCFGLFHRNIGK